MKNKQAKHLRQNFMKSVRAMNDNILNDELWRGRFYMWLKDFRYEMFSDHSGIMGWAMLQCEDLKTGKTENTWIEVFPPFYNSKIFEFMNDFIVETCDVWAETDVRTDKTVYRVR